MKGDRLLCRVPRDGLCQIRHDKCCAFSQFLCSVIGFLYFERRLERGHRGYARNTAKDGLFFLALCSVTESRFGQTATASLSGCQCH